MHQMPWTMRKGADMLMMVSVVWCQSARPKIAHSQKTTVKQRVFVFVPAKESLHWYTS